MALIDIQNLYLNTENGKSLKNSNAHRDIPLPNIIIDLGFLNYLDTRIKKGVIKLFEIPRSGENVISEYFTRVIDKNKKNL